jgi:thymidylate synthase
MFKDFPKYYRQSITTLSESGFIGVITFWSYQKDVLASILPAQQRKVICIGNLYTEEGILYIIKNIYLCPQLSYLIFVGYDRNEIYDKFFSFRDGIEESYVIQFMNHFSRNHCRAELSTINEIIKNMTPPSTTWITEQHVFPEEAITPKTLDSERIGFVVRDTSLRRLWGRVLTKINLFGVIKKSEFDSLQKELLGVCSVFSGASLEMTKDMPGFSNIHKYKEQILSPTPDEGLKYTYGSRLFGDGGIDAIIKELKQKQYSRRAIALTWRTSDYESDTPPCLVLIDCKLSLQKLYMTCYFRSQDMYQAFCLNMYGLRLIQEHISSKIEFEKGDLMFISNSAHVYQKDFFTLASFNELDCSMDKRGYFIISIEDEEIKIQHLNYSNTLNFTYKNKDVNLILTKVQPFISEISHALYLGKEIERAHSCIINKKVFIQE